MSKGSVVNTREHAVVTVAARALLTTGGLGPYRRDLLAVLARPEGALYTVRWGEAYVVPELERLEELVGSFAVFAVLMHPSAALPLRVVQIADVDVVRLRGRDDSFVRLELAMGPWTAVLSDDVKMLDTETLLPSREVGGDRGTVQTNLAVLDPPLHLQAHFAPESWAKTVSALKEDERYREAAYATVVRLAPLTQKRWWHGTFERLVERSAVRGHVRARRVWSTYAHAATQRRAGAIVRSGRLYEIRLLYYAQRLKDLDQGENPPALRLSFGNLDPALTQVGPDERLQPGVFERADLRFTARLARSRQSVLTVSTQADAVSAHVATPDVPLNVQLRPRLWQRVAVTLAGVVAVVAVITGATVARGGWRDALLILGSTSAATLIAYFLRPED